MEKVEKPNIELALSYKQTPYEVTVGNNDCILYALGIGFQQDMMNDKHYKFTYENADEFGAFPTQAVVVCHKGPFADGDFDVPGLPKFNPM